MTIPSLKLNDDKAIPQLGLGLWQVTDQAEFNTAFEAAVEAGYRHFDTAQLYQNEQFLGEAWEKSGLKRKDVFITTKILVSNFGKHRLRKSFEESLRKLRTDYVDLLLLHFPVPVLRKNAWLELEKIKVNGQAHSIGVSNYTVRHMQEMQNYANEQPAVNQFEMHVFLQQTELVKYCKDASVMIEAYSPLARAREMNNEVVNGIAAKHDKSYAQIMLRWLIEQGAAVLPKSVTPERIRSNADIFDFKLDKEDLAAIAQLDHEWHTTWNPTHVP